MLTIALAVMAIGLGGARAGAARNLRCPPALQSEPTPYSLDRVRAISPNGIIGIIATSRPNKGTHELVDAKWPGEGGAVHQAYRVRNDIQTWFNDPAIFS
jgi:hypothetical protein